MNNYENEFVKLTNLLKEPLSSSNLDSIKKILIKLNNKNYYNKFVKTHPGIDYNFYLKRITNPLILCVTNMLKLIKTHSCDESLRRALQEEISWAYNSYSKSSDMFRRKSTSITH